MTSRRRTPTEATTRQFLTSKLAMICAAVMLAGCAALPEDAPVFEQLDEDTGLTITRLGRPMELYRETFQRDPAGRFAFLAPFETNQMGKREHFLWIALPLEVAGGTSPDVEIDGRALALGTPAREPDTAGLRKSPYKVPTPWSATFYYRIGDDVVTKLAAAGTLSIRVTEQTKEGTAITVFASSVADSRLKDFAARP